MSAAAQAFVILLREGMEAALVVSIVLTFLHRTGRERLRGAVYGGIAAAVIVSVAGAALLQRIEIDQEAFEGFLLLFAAVMVGTLLVWMHRHARTLRREIERGLAAITAPERPSVAASVGVFLFTFVTVLREGIETALLLRVSGFNTEELLTLAAGLLAIAISIGFAIGFVRGAWRIDLARFFRVTTIVLAFFVLQLLVNSVHELTEAEIVPTTPQLMAAIGPVVRNGSLFVAGLLLLPLWLLLVPGRSAPATTAANPAEARKQRAVALRSQRGRQIAAGVALAAVLLLVGDTFFFRRPLTLSPATPVSVVDGAVRIPTADLAERTLHRFSTSVAGRTVRFLLRREHGRTIGAMDACRLCGDRGYVQDGELLLCVNCEAEINPATFGQPGGCNPIPIAVREEADAVIIAEAELARHASIFTDPGHARSATVSCLVCGMEVDSARAVTVEYAGRTVRFCPMPGCAEAFQRNPEPFLRARQAIRR